MDNKDAAHVLVISDSCFSGALVEGAERGVTPPGERARDDDAEEWVQRLIAKKSRYVLTSGAYDESVSDAGSRSGKHSVFADCLLEELRRPLHDTFTAKKLGMRLRRMVGANSDQTPTDGILKGTGHRGGEFVFIRTGSTKTREAAAAEPEPVAPTWPTLSLTGVLSTDNQRAGTINGQVVAEGETIEGVRIKKVIFDGNKGVELDWNGRTRFLGVGEDTTTE